jgi:hypothetical protein
MITENIRTVNQNDGGASTDAENVNPTYLAHASKALR